MSDQRCRRGACGPICVADSDCGTDQVCRAGACVAPPECAVDSDCASGFTCTNGTCQCVNDTSCQAGQTCTGGVCVAQKRCTGDSDCAGSGKRCEIAQGICLPICNLPQDCAPTLDPDAAFALYSCVLGTCTTRCLTDVTCGGAGFICTADLCTVAQCKTLTDCPQNQYCSSATFGRCTAFQTCDSTQACPANTQCGEFTMGTCPPGFDCSQSICQELPTCLIDSDCVSISGNPPVTTQTGYCGQGHCQPTVSCAGASCGPGLECIAASCVPATCRGVTDCPSGQACVDGACATAPQPTDITRILMRPQTATLATGDTLQLQLVAYELGGASYPVTAATAFFVATDGGTTGTATVDPSGLLTATGAGTLRVHGNVTGSLVPDAVSTITIYPPVVAGRRVIVVDAAQKAPLAGVTVSACPASDCTSPISVLTDDAGVAAFETLDAGPATFSVVSKAIRPVDGLPAFESATVLATAAQDLYLPLRDNPVHSAAGLSGSISFSDVSTTGQYWAGFSAASASDLPSWDAQFLLGGNFSVTIPGLNQTVPVPAPVVLYTSPGFGIPQEVKSKSLPFSQAGTVRHAVAFAGRTDASIALSLRSTDFLSYLGAFDYALQTDLSVQTHAMIPDLEDVNGNGLCSDTAKCPMGTEDVPDYAQFTTFAQTPSRQQNRRTEVVVPGLPSTLDQVVLIGIEVTVEGGVLPTGFASKAAGATGSDGTRAIGSVVLRTGPAYAGLEISTPGVWVLGASNAGTSSSARITKGPILEPRTLVAPFLPVPEGSTWAAGTRTFSPGQPQWASAYSSGAELARVEISGSQSRHTVYFAVQGSQTAVTLPALPAGAGMDPTAEDMVSLEVVTIDLSQSVPSVDDIFTLAGPNLGALEKSIDGYSRFQR